MKKVVKEFRVFEVDKYNNRWFVCRHSTLESARRWLEGQEADKEMGATFKVFDERGEEV